MHILIDEVIDALCFSSIPIGRRLDLTNELIGLRHHLTAPASVCCYCKKVRDSEGNYRHASHGICPDCKTEVISDKNTEATRVGSATPVRA